MSSALINAYAAIDYTEGFTVIYFLDKYNISNVPE